MPTKKMTCSTAYKSIFDNLPCAVYRCRFDEQRTMEMLTNKIEEILGYVADDFIINKRRRYIDSIFADDRESVLDEVDQCAKRGESFGIEYRVVHKDGRILWVFENGAAVMDDAGQPIYIDGTITEITERKITEQSLGRRERYLSALAEVERRLLRGRGVEEQLNRILEVLGKAANASRVYVFENSTDAAGDLCMTQKAEWCNVGIKPEINNPEFQRMPYKHHFGRWLKFFERGQAISGDVREFPEEERAVLELYGVQAVAVFPIIAHEKVYGLIGFDNCLHARDWGESELEFLRGAASALSLSYDHEQSDKEMQAAKEQLEAVLEAMPGYVSWIDKEMRYLGVNRQLAHALNRAPQDFIGEQVGFINSKFTEFVKSFLESERQSTIGEVSINVGNFVATQLVAAQKYMQGNAAVFVGIDITARKHAEEKLGEQAALLDITRDAVLLLDVDNRILYLNRSAEQLYGWKAEEVIGKHKEDLAYRGNEAFYLEKIQQEVLHAGTWRGELVQYAKDGRKIIVDSRRTIIKGKDEQPEKILVVNTDITEAKQLQSQMLRNQRMDSVGMLASGIAHDMNNILSPITASLMLLKSKQTDEKSLRWIEMLESNTYRGAELMRQVLSFARGESTERTAFNVMHIVKDIEGLAAQTFPKSIEFNVSTKKGLWSLFGDPVQLHQVLMNLVVNARDAMPNGGALNVSAENFSIDESNLNIHVDAKVGSYLKFAVSDTGSGIDPENLERIFDPFFTTKSAGKGTGLGLSIVFSIVRSFGGFVTVESRVGEGTTFSVYLPALKNDAVDSEKTPLEDVKSETNGEVILLAEDEDLVREIAGEILRNAGYVVIPARNGAEAVELYEQRQMDIRLLLTDLMMPKMDGLVCIQEIQKINSNLPIVAMSGVMDGDKVTRLKTIGIEKTISKPYSGERLLSIVREALAGNKSSAI